MLISEPCIQPLFDDDTALGESWRIEPLSTVVMTDEEAEYFSISVRCGSFAQAARRLNIKTTQLRRKLAHLEERVGSALFVQKGNVLVPSRTGRKLQAQLSARSPQKTLIASTSDRQPMVRLAVAEPLLCDLLSRGLIDYLRNNAATRLQIASFNSDALLPTLDVEIMVWSGGPEEVISVPGFHGAEPVKLASLNYLPHIAKRYSRESIRPSQLSDLDDYMLVQLAQDQNVAAFGPWNNVIHQRVSAMTVVQSYDLSCKLIRCGACIGLLPAYISRIDRSLAALPDLFSQAMERQVWLAVHPDAMDKIEVQSIVELVLETFHERREWFKPSV